MTYSNSLPALEKQNFSQIQTKFWKREIEIPLPAPILADVPGTGIYYCKLHEGWPVYRVVQ